MAASRSVAVAFVTIVLSVLPALTTAQDIIDPVDLPPLAPGISDGVAIEAAGLHTLTVAANTNIQVTSRQVNNVVDGMDLLVLRSDYRAGRNADGSTFPADVACAGVDYQLQGGGLVRHAALPQTFVSSSQQFGWNAFRSAVRADLYIVNSITCGTVTNAAGCAPLGGKPRIVKATTGLDPQVWVHEDMHTLGIGHSNMPPETVCPTNFRNSPEGTWRRIMYCRVNANAKGLTRSECEDIGGTPAPVAISGPEMAAVAIAEEVAPQGAIPDDLRAALERPYAGAFQDLSQDEIGIVRSILRDRSEVDLLDGSVQALGEVGDLSDAHLMLDFLEDRSLDGPEIVVAKIAVPPAAYQIAARLAPDEATSLIAQVFAYSDPERASEILGNAGESLWIQATVGLGNAAENALPFIDTVLMHERGEAIVPSRDLPGADASVLEQVESMPAVNVDLLGVARNIAVEK